MKECDVLVGENILWPFLFSAWGQRPQPSPRSTSLYGSQHKRRDFNTV